MASLSALPATRPMKASGFTGLVGLFAGLCALFAACATIVDWYDETTQARWPIVSAIVDRADIAVSYRAPRDGGGKLWQLSARVRYEANGKARLAVLNSRAAGSEEEAAQFASWAAQNRGNHIDLRYDPSRPGRVVLASPEGPFATEKMRTDFFLLMLAAIASVAFSGLARIFRAREARAAPRADSNASLAIGVVSAAVGLLVTGFALDRAINAYPFGADGWMAVPAGLMFVFAGILIGLPAKHERARSWLATLMVTCFAVTFDWVAFGPGERHFTGSIGSVGFPPGEMIGRFLFGVVAVVLDICAAAMWVGQFRHAIRPAAVGPADSTA